MNFLLVLIIALGSGRGTVPSRHATADRIEFNTSLCYSKPIRQVIFWRWNAQYSRYDVRSYYIIDDDDRTLWGWGVVEQKDGILFGKWFVRSKVIVHTVTEYDPERSNARLLLDEFRVRMPWERRDGSM